jgi:hypothetical protein
MFYSYALIEKYTKLYGGEVLTVCPPSTTDSEQLNYNRAIHLSLKFSTTANLLHSVFYLTFRFTFPASNKPSKFSSLEVFNSDYVSIYKIRISNFLLAGTNEPDFYTFTNTFENNFFNVILQGRQVQLVNQGE